MDVNDDSALNLYGSLWQWGYFHHYFRYFGFWETTKDEERSALYNKFHYEINSLTPTALFHLLGPELLHTRKIEYWNLSLRRMAGDWRGTPGGPLPTDEEVWELDSFIAAFTSLFNGMLTQHLPRLSGIFFDGTFELKVAVRKNCWRRIRLSSHCTLYHLHEKIQQAFSFGDDHLYAFFLDGIRWSPQRAFWSPDAQDEPIVTNARLGELDLSIGHTFLYLFDFGDEWEFIITVEDILPIDSRKDKPQVIASKGNSPEQYSY